MKYTFVALILMISLVSAFPVDNESAKFKSKIGFLNGEDKIVGHRFFEGGSKFLVIGEKNLQVWDVQSAKLLKSIPHNISQFAPRGFFSKYVLLNVPQEFDLMIPYLIDPNGKWIAVIGETDEKVKAVIIRDLKELKPIKILKLPNVPTQYIQFDDKKSEIITFGVTDKFGEFAVWDKETFDQKRFFSINEYKWHKLIKDEQKLIAGAGDTKMSWNIWNEKHGENLTLRDVKSGAIEREYSAQNLEPRTSFERTVISSDERLLMSERNDRYFVWEIDGNGVPLYEISAKGQEPKLNFEAVVGNQFIVFSFDKKLQVFDISGIGEPKYVLASDKVGDSVKLRDHTKDGKYLVASEDNKISIIETGGSGKPVFEISRENENERFTIVELVDDNRYLAVGRVNNKEKKSERTEFYDLETGDIAFEVPLGFDARLKFSPNKNIIYSEGIGVMRFWNITNKAPRFLMLELLQQEETLEEYATPTIVGNAESVVFSPDFRFSLRFGGKITGLQDNEKMVPFQPLFDAEKVKYDKKKRVKKSGLGDAGWSPDGRYVFAKDEKSKTILLWEVSY